MTSGTSRRGRVAGARYLDPVVLARLGNLEWVAHMVVDGFVNGLHKATHLGVSTDFAEHRAYTLGDDIRRIDWRVYGRTDRLYIKQFVAQTNVDIIIALDVSASMGFASSAVSKHQFGCIAAACLGQLARQQRDRVGLVTFDSDIRDFVPPLGSRSRAFFHRLEAAQPAGEGRLSVALEQVAVRLRRRGLVVVISDAYEPVPGIVSALENIKGHGHDVTLIQVLDPAEISLGIPATDVLQDMETGQRIPVSLDAIRSDYQQAAKEHRQELAAACARRAMDYVLADSGKPLDDILAAYLTRRAARTRTR